MPFVTKQTGKYSECYFENENCIFPVNRQAYYLKLHLLVRTSRYVQHYNASME